MDGMTKANINGLPQGIEAYFGTPQGMDQLNLYLFCIHCRSNGTAHIFSDGKFANLKADHRTPLRVVEAHMTIFHSAKK